MEFLYHYTSLETLALILKNKTISFNNLLNVDDIEEAETEDMGKFGRFVYVSCWTEDNVESIPLWNLYTPDMHGVRLRLPKFPFKKYSYNAGQFHFSQDVETYINIESIYNENKASIVANQPSLIEVEYTDNKKLLFPKVKTESCENGFQKYTNAKDISEVTGIELSYFFEELGKFKHENWQFQKERRYLLTSTPKGLRESTPPSFEKQKEFIRRIENENLKPPYQNIFLNLDENAIEHLEVVFGPKMSEAEKILAISLLKQYAPITLYRDSSLRIVYGNLKLNHNRT